MGQDELPYWMALYEIDPWGEYRADVRHAVNAAYIGAVWGGKAKPGDLVPDYDQDHARANDQKLALIQWEGFVAAHNAAQKRKEGSGR